MGENRESDDTDGGNRGVVDGGSHHETSGASGGDPDGGPDGATERTSGHDADETTDVSTDGSTDRDSGGFGDADTGGRSDADTDGHSDADTGRHSDAEVDVETSVSIDVERDVSASRDVDRDAPPPRRRSRPGDGRGGDTFRVDEVDAATRSDGAGPNPTESAGATVFPERTTGRDAAGGRVTSDGARAGPVPESDEVGLRDALDPEESLHVVRDGTLLGEYRGPATVGVTDRRLVVVTDADQFVSVPLDQVSLVRSSPRTTLDVTTTDVRITFALGYLLAIVGFLGVLSNATSTLTPALTLTSLAGLVAFDHLWRVGADVDVGDVGERVLDPLAERVDGSDEVAGAADDRVDVADGAVDAADDVVDTTDGAVDGADDLVDRVSAVGAHLGERVETGDLLRWGAAALAVVPFLVVLGIEVNVLIPVFALLTFGGIGLVVYTFRNGDSFDGFEIDRQRQRTVTASLDHGRTVTVRTDADSDLDRKLAGDVASSTARRPNEDDETR